MVLDVGGVGYELGVSAVTAGSLPEVGTPGVTLLARLIVREDSMTLFGFSTREERSLFDRLCAISGVGPKLALSVLSTFTPAQLAGVVAAEDAGMMATVPGRGQEAREPPSARARERVCQGPHAAEPGHGRVAAGRGGIVATAPAAGSGVEDDVMAALLAMGFTGEEATLALDGHEDAGATTTKAALEYALKRLGRRS